MNGSEAQLENARQLIAAGERIKARRLLAMVCADAPSAEAYWLVSQTLVKPDDVEKALRRALRYDPNHVLAAEALRRFNDAPDLTNVPVPLEDLPLVFEGDDDGAAESFASGKSKKKKTAIRFSSLMLGFVTLAGIIFGTAAFVIWRTGFYDVPYLFTGPYFISRAAHVESDDLPCDTYTVYGDVVGGAGFTMRVTARRNFEQSVVVDNNGRYRVDIPGEFVPQHTVDQGNEDPYLLIMRERGEQFISFRLFDANGVDVSGVRTTAFHRHGCIGYFEFSRFDGGRKFGRAPEVGSMEVVETSYQVIMTELTSVPSSIMVEMMPTYLTCDWVGIIGRAYTREGVVNGVAVEAWSLSKPQRTIYTTTTGQDARNTGWREFEGVWLMPLPKVDRYYVRFLYETPDESLYDLAGGIVRIPAETDCQRHVILMTLIPIEALETPPYPL